MVSFIDMKIRELMQQAKDTKHIERLKHIISMLKTLIQLKKENKETN